MVDHISPERVVIDLHVLLETAKILVGSSSRNMLQHEFGSVFHQYLAALDPFCIITQGQITLRSVQEIFFTLVNKATDHMIVYTEGRRGIIIGNVIGPDPGQPGIKAQ